MPQLVRALGAEAGDAPVSAVLALPERFHRRVDRLLEHDGFIRVRSHLHLIAVVPRYPDVKSRTYLETARLGHGEALGMVHEAGGDRMQVLDIENYEGRPVYVHAKLTVIDDDVWAAVRSANLKVLSWTYDSELSSRSSTSSAIPARRLTPAARGPGLQLRSGAAPAAHARTPRPR